MLLLRGKRIEDKLDHLATYIDNEFDIVKRRLKDMREATARLIREVEETKDANTSLITLVQGLSQQIRESIGDEAELNRIADDLDAEQARIAEAVAANTVTPPAPAGGPEPAQPEGDSSDDSGGAADTQEDNS